MSIQSDYEAKLLTESVEFSMFFARNKAFLGINYKKYIFPENQVRRDE